MRTLLLMRHAKSSWDQPELADLERPLVARGREAAPAVARYLVEHGLIPELVLGSPALRVRETWQLMAPVLGERVACKTLRASMRVRRAGCSRRSAGSKARSGP